MKTLSYFTVIICFFLTCLAGCVSTPEPSVPTATQQTIAAAVEDAISIGLVPVLTKNPSYIGAAQTVALGLGSFAGDTITPADVDAFLGKTSMTDEDRRAVAGIVNATWGVYTRRYVQQVGESTRPDVKLFLGAVSNGIKLAIAATPRPTALILRGGCPNPPGASNAVSVEQAACSVRV